MKFDLLRSVAAELQRTDIDPEEGLPEVPQEARNFLGRLALLQNVPLTHLLPDGGLIPLRAQQDERPERGALRLFRIDPEWIESLLGGALSVGEPEARKILLQEALSGQFTAEAHLADALALFHRQSFGTYKAAQYDGLLQSFLTRRALRTERKNGVLTAVPTPAQTSWNYSGFLLRSSLLDAWNNVEVRAKGLDPNAPSGSDGETYIPLQLLRFEKLDKQTLLCICEGIVKQVEIVQPAEGIHYGMERREDGFYVDAATKMPFRNDGAPGVVDLAALRSKGVQQSTDVARKMLRAAAPLKVVLDIDWNASPENSPL